MSLDWAAKNFEFNPALGIHGQNAGHRRVGILTANRDITACYRDKSDACVNQSGPHPTISRHVHEINRKVIRHRDHSSSLLVPPARRVRNRGVETAVEPSDGQLRNVRKQGGRLLCMALPGQWAWRPDRQPRRRPQSAGVPAMTTSPGLMSESSSASSRNVQTNPASSSLFKSAAISTLAISRPHSHIDVVHQATERRCDTAPNDPASARSISCRPSPFPNGATALVPC